MTMYQYKAGSANGGLFEASRAMWIISAFSVYNLCGGLLITTACGLSLLRFSGSGFGAGWAFFGPAARRPGSRRPGLIWCGRPGVRASGDSRSGQGGLSMGERRAGGLIMGRRSGLVRPGRWVCGPCPGRGRMGLIKGILPAKPCQWQGALIAYAICQGTDSPPRGVNCGTVFIE